VVLTMVVPASNVAPTAVPGGARDGAAIASYHVAHTGAGCQASELQCNNSCHAGRAAQCMCAVGRNGYRRRFDSYHSLAPFLHAKKHTQLEYHKQDDD
jgi:hypothetical protein